jgi:diguanylate cyclase (GGDEF)-like protein/putative nucleotidyltransferase with HDIG domain
VVVGGVAPSIRGLIQRAADRLFVGGHLAHEQVAFRLNEVGSRARSVDELARETTELCQRVTASGVVALLLTSKDELRLAAMSGPFARLQPEWTIATENALLQAVCERNEPTTPLMLERLIASGEFLPEDVAEFGPYRLSILAPIVSSTKTVGCLVVGPKVYDAPYSMAELDLLRLVAGQSGVAIQNAELLEQLREQAETDFLTGLPNHRRLHEELAAVLHRAEPGEEPVAIAMIDLDNFKMLNDVHGHQAGDDALRRIGSTMRAAMRPQDMVGRYGGDEFLIIMPGTTAEEANQLMASLERTVRKVALVADSAKSSDGERLPARISWGVAAFPEGGRTSRSLVASADSQLLERRYEVRRAGALHTERPTVARLLEQDPEKLRYARAVLDMLDAKDPYTSEHSQQVASLALLVAEELSLSDRDRLALWIGGLLHDIGKIGTPREVLRKPGSLSIDEWDRMREHPSLGETLARGLFDMQEIVDIVGCHHERFDGSGYPRGLAGNEIPFLARATSVADAFSAMVHDRPYRKGLSWDDAVDELYRHSGTQFDPELLDVFARAIGRERSAEQAA